MLVVSNDGFNRAADVVTVVPLTRQAGKLRRIYPYEILIPERAAGNPVASILMPHHIRTVSKQRLLDRMDALADPLLQEAIEDHLLEHLGMDFVPDI